MNVRSWYIPKSKRGRQVAQLFRREGYDIKNKEIMGKYLCNSLASIAITPELAVKIAFILDPEYAAIEERRAFKEADEARKEGFDDFARRLKAGWWALGM